MVDYRKAISRRPKFFGDGQVVAMFPEKWQRTKDERALTIQLVCQRSLFGWMYQTLFPKYFREMPPKSGVFISCFATTSDVFPGVKFPGDLDMLIIPYEGNELVLSKALAVEVKIIRASYEKQGKSPNEFGFSQAKALLNIGFPYVAVMHLIVSDESPLDAWRDVAEATVLNAETGEVSEPRPIKWDMLPSDLTRRAYGRLIANYPSEELGFLAMYMNEDKNSVCLPSGRPVIQNPKVSINLLECLEVYFEKYFQDFFDTPRYD